DRRVMPFIAPGILARPHDQKSPAQKCCDLLPVGRHLTDGDLQITNTSAFGDVGEEYNLFGARVADTKMAPLAVPPSYNWLPPSDLPSGVLELVDLFEVHARDLASGSRTVPSFEDALFMQRLLEQAAVSSAS